MNLEFYISQSLRTKLDINNWADQILIPFIQNYLSFKISYWSALVNTSLEGKKLELVSKELNHFGGIASFFRDWAPRTLTGGA